MLKQVKHSDAPFAHEHRRAEKGNKNIAGPCGAAMSPSMRNIGALKHLIHNSKTSHFITLHSPLSIKTDFEMIASRAMLRHAALKPLRFSAVRSASTWANVPQGPPVSKHMQLKLF
jgi:hypothetical protein